MAVRKPVKMSNSSVPAKGRLHWRSASFPHLISISFKRSFQPGPCSLGAAGDHCAIHLSFIDLALPPSCTPSASWPCPCPPLTQFGVCAPCPGGGVPAVDRVNVRTSIMAHHPCDCSQLKGPGGVHFLQLPPATSAETMVSTWQLLP